MEEKIISVTDVLREKVNEMEVTINKIDNIDGRLSTLQICETFMKKDGVVRRMPSFAHDTDVGLDMYPKSVVLEAYSGNSYEIELSDDDITNDIFIEEAEMKERKASGFWTRLKRFFKGEDYRLGWKRLKFDTGISVEPDSFYFYVGAPNSRVIKTDVILQNSVGIIDPTYRGTIRFMYRNLEGGFIRDSVVKLSNCCGQIMPSLRIKPEVTWTKELSETERGEGGFGSSAS